MQERALDVGPWTLEKLSLLRKYLEAYVQATNRIRQRGDEVTYLDLSQDLGESGIVTQERSQTALH